MFNLTCRHGKIGYGMNIMINKHRNELKHDPIYFSTIDEQVIKNDKILKREIIDTRLLKRTRQNFSIDRYNETSYYIEDGLRKVYPYYFQFFTFAKKRWIGRKISDVFKTEFKRHSKFDEFLRAGCININNKSVPLDYVLKPNDLITQVILRHENPVTSQPIDILHVDDDIVVINKPASIPVHPCGRYRNNSIVYILAKENNMKNLGAIFRLDRLASGLLILGRNLKTIKNMQQQLLCRHVIKQYVCKVNGEFPSQETECHEPIQELKNKITLVRVSQHGKDSSTMFRRLNYDTQSNTSVVLCQPKTGRMHQIRVHLQYMGYPIANDPIYNNPIFGPSRGKGGDTDGKTYEQIVEEMIVVSESKPGFLLDQYKSQMPTQQAAPDCGSSITDANTINSAIHRSLAPDPKCSICRLPQDNIKLHNMVLYLHAWKYEGLGWKYEVDLPKWANVM